MKSRPFDDAAARAAWNRGAVASREFVRSGADFYRLHVHGPGLLAACAVQRGERALDLGCGEGYFARELARAGARVVGVDVSASKSHPLRPRRSIHRSGSSTAWREAAPYFLIFDLRLPPAR